MGPPRSLVGTRLVVIVMSVLEEGVWVNYWKLDPIPSFTRIGEGSSHRSDTALSLTRSSHRFGHSIKDGDMISTMMALLVLQSSQPSLLPLFESIWIQFQLTGRELLRLMCRVRGVAPQVCKNDQNVEEEEEDHISDRENAQQHKDV